MGYSSVQLPFLMTSKQAFLADGYFLNEVQGKKKKKKLFQA